MRSHLASAHSPSSSCPSSNYPPPSSIYLDPSANPSVHLSIAPSKLSLYPAIPTYHSYVHMPSSPPHTQPSPGPCSLSPLYPLYSAFYQLPQCTKDTRSSHALHSACPKLARAALGIPPTHEATGVSHPQHSAPLWHPDTSRNEFLP